MCGIAGFRGAFPLAPQRVQRALAALRHRGPDHAAARHWRAPDGTHVALLHTRLSIIDLDPRAHQPFHAGRRWMVFNGELYNYRELRDELGRGGAWATTSDTEVFLRAIEQLGWEGLDRCEGMWALAVYDDADGSLVLCRDRFGEKPLYLYEDASGFYFASESKAIEALLGRRLQPNLEHLSRYLVNGYKALYKSGQTFFQGLEELPAGTWLRLGARGERCSRRYWSPAVAPQEMMSYDEAVQGARERLLRAVELRLRADVPLAFCMSGGVDSNALIGVAKRAFGYDVHGFTIVDADPQYNEQALVTAAAQELRIRHTLVPLRTSGFLERLRRLVRQHDAPVATITYYVHWLLMQEMASHGYRIAVSGTAADELFSGYYDHHLAYLYAVREEAVLHAAARQAWETHVRPAVRNPYLGDPELFIKDPAFRGHIFLGAEDFSAYLRAPWSEPFTEQPLAKSLLRNRMLNELLYENVPVILHEDDLNAMSVSMENRSPYLDRQLFDWCARIPDRHLVRDGYAKAILRDAVRGFAPDVVLDAHRKVGFNASIHSLLDVRDPAVRGELLAESPVFEHVRRERIAELLDKPELPNSESKFLFSFVNAKIFLEEFGR